MFDRFYASYGEPTRLSHETFEVPTITRPVAGWSELFTQSAGATFLDGLYRLHDSQSARTALGWVGDMFPTYRSRVVPFGFDWLGRQFVLDAARLRASEPLVLLLEPGSGEAYEVPATLVEFHNGELVDDPEACVSVGLFEAWSASPNARPLGHSEGVGYKVPLFLGGADDVANLEISDLDVYWTLTAQLFLGTADTPFGTGVDSVDGR